MGIKFTDVWFGYDPATPVLKGVSFEAFSGEVLGLLGKNGAGKTTTFRMAAGLLRPDEGAVEIDGISVLEKPLDVRRRTAFIPDRLLLYELLSAQENLNMFALLWEVPRDVAAARGQELLQAVGLWSVRNQWVRDYSSGMKQKLALCVALLHQPSVIVMDEPFTGLDIDSVMWARQRLKLCAAAGATILFSSHSAELIEAFADSVAILREGRIVQRSSVDEIKHHGGLVRYWSTRTAAGPAGV